MVANITPSIYNVNFDATMPKLTKSCLSFQKMPQRKPLELINRAQTNDSIIYDNIDKYYQSLSKYKKVQAPDLSKG